jgi:regulatory protein
MARDLKQAQSAPAAEPRRENMALRYVGRYATTRARLRTYLRRKLAERGWAADVGPDIDALVERLTSLGYVDDAAFAAARAASLQRRGYGERRIAQSLGAAGVAAEDMAGAREMASENALAAAIRFAQRKRVGPYAAEKADRAGREKAFAAMVRAGHSIETIRLVLACSPGELPDCE